MFDQAKCWTDATRLLLSMSSRQYTDYRLCTKERKGLTVRVGELKAEARNHTIESGIGGAQNTLLPI